MILRRRILAEELLPEQHLYYTIDKVVSASFPAKTLTIVNSPSSGTKSSSNTLTVTIDVIDHYLDGHGVERTRTIELTVSTSISFTATDTYTSSSNSSQINVTFTSKTVTEDGVSINLAIGSLSQKLSGTGALTYDKSMTLTATVGSTSKTKSAGNLRFNQSSTGRVNISFV